MSRQVLWAEHSLLQALDLLQSSLLLAIRLCETVIPQTELLARQIGYVAKVNTLCL
jgi:hypothetical protein